MRSRIIAALAAVCLVAVGVGAALLNGGSEEYERYHQHREAQQLGDLSAEDQEAASSTNIDAETFASHLPVVSIDTRGQEVPGSVASSSSDEADGVEKENEIRTKDVHYELAADGRETIATDFTLFSQEDAANRLTDAPSFESQAEIRYRGNSSRHFSKKSYAVTFTESDRLTNKEIDVLGMGADEDWILNGPFLDKTMVRNYLSFNIFGQFMPFVPEVRFCELFVNGEYQGLYLLMESVKVSEERVDLSPPSHNSVATSYLLRKDWANADDDDVVDDLLGAMRKEPNTNLTIVYPTESVVTADMEQWIRSDFNSFEKSLYSYDYDTAEYGYKTYIDVQSFVDYAIVNEFSLNTDAGKYSTYYYRDIRGKICIGPIWDYNNAYNNYFEDDLSDSGFFMPSKPLYFMLFKDEHFVNETISRYRELRSTYLSDESLLSYIDETIAYLGPAIERNNAVWGYAFDPSLLTADEKLTPDERNPRSFSEAVDDLKGSITSHGAWLDRYIENLRQYSHESVNKRYNH